MSTKSRWQDIFLHLKQGGFDVYSPAQKTGECKAPYLVVKDASSSQFLNYSSTRSFYDILCYVPKAHFSDLEHFVGTVEAAMKGLSPMIQPTYTKTPSFYDDSVKGHMVSIQYYNYRKIDKEV